MHVCYFSNHFAARFGTGVARYSRQLFARLARDHAELRVTPVATWSDLDPDALATLRARSGLRTLPWGRRWTPLAWTFLDAPPIERWLGEPVDVVHALALGFPVATRRPFAVTVHDIGPLTHPEYFSKNRPWLLSRSLAHAARGARAIICVSQATADEVTGYVSKHFHMDVQDKIHVIHEGVDPALFEPPDPACLRSIRGLPAPGKPFLLMAGKLSPRKNVHGVVKALASLLDRIPHHLVLVGGVGWDSHFALDALRAPKVAERVSLIGYVTDEQLHALYCAAAAYVHPSLFEGFGLTVLEAMAAGCPVITSNTSSLPEVAGDAALLVDPSSVDAIADAIHTVCCDPKLAGELAALGRVQARSFDWDDCAAKIADVYRLIR